MKVKKFIYLLILSLLFSTSILTSQNRGEQVQALAPLPSSQTPFPLVSETLNSEHFLNSFGSVYAEFKIVKDMEQWSKISINMDLFNKKIIYYSDHIWANYVRRNIQYCEFCSKNH